MKQEGPRLNLLAFYEGNEDMEVYFRSDDDLGQPTQV